MKGNVICFSPNSTYICDEFEKKICDLTESELNRLLSHQLKRFKTVVINGKEYTSVPSISNNSNSMKTNETKVICPNCGQEIAIPNHEHYTAGVAIGKDSGLGTVVLPKVNNSSIPMFEYVFDYYIGDDDISHDVVTAENVREAIAEFFHSTYGVSCVSDICCNGISVLTKRLREDIQEYISMPRNNSNNSNNSYNNSNNSTTMNNNSNNSTMNNSTDNNSMMQQLMSMLVKELSQNKEQRREFFETLAKASGFDTSELAPAPTVIEQTAKSEPAKVQATVNKEIKKHIADSEWVHNVKLYHNHAERQMYAMLGSIDKVKNANDDYADNLRNIDYDYQFTQTIKQLKNIAYLLSHDSQGAKEIYRWYNKARVVGLLQQDLDNTRDFVAGLERKGYYHNYSYNRVAPKKKVGGFDIPNRDYVRIPGITKFNAMPNSTYYSDLSKECVFETELDVCLFSKLETIIKVADKCDSPKDLLQKVIEYDRLRIRLPYDYRTKASSWVNAFKGLGAYRTLVNLIRFDGIRFYAADVNNNTNRYGYAKPSGTPLSQEQSLEHLERIADEISSGSRSNSWNDHYGIDGYAMLGLLRTVIANSNLTSWPSKED